MISIHIQLLLGLVLYFLSPKVQFVKEAMSEPILRFYTVEHILLMVVAIIFITLGRKKAEKQTLPARRHKMILRYYGLGLLIIFVAIPWPFIYDVGAGYY